jgi:HNH endonuclease
MKPELTHERLLELLSYDPETGLFRWLVARGGTAKAGSIAGSPTMNGYVNISIDGRLYRAHRLAFLYMLGRWPDPEADHRDLNRANNRWTNLREATSAQNQANVSAHRDNKLGIKGVVQQSSGKYRAQINVGGRQIYLGTWDRSEIASFFYEAAALAFFGEFARI